MFLLFLVRFGLLSGHLLGTSCSLGWPYVLCILIICNLSCFQLWFEGWIWILIVSVPGLCILFTYGSEVLCVSNIPGNGHILSFLLPLINKKGSC